MHTNLTCVMDHYLSRSIFIIWGRIATNINITTRIRDKENKFWSFVGLPKNLGARNYSFFKTNKQLEAKQKQSKATKDDCKTTRALELFYLSSYISPSISTYLIVRVSVLMYTIGVYICFQSDQTIQIFMVKQFWPKWLWLFESKYESR